jgi:RNA polymerase sigma-70 factor (ECF subfamily)
MRGERAHRLVDALAQLPEAQAEAVRLRYLEGLTIAETAKRLEKSPAAVKALVSRGLRALASRLTRGNC